MTNSSLAHMYWSEQLGGRPLNAVVHGSAAPCVVKAAGVVSAGLADVVVVFFGKSNRPNGPRGIAVPVDRAVRVSEWEGQQHGIYMTTWYALWARRYMHEYGVTHEELAEIAVLDRHHATLNPASVMGPKGEITVQDVLESRPICEPLNLFDCSIDNDGGYAIVVAAGDIARDCRHDPVWVLGASESYATDFYATIPEPWFPEGGSAVRNAANRAFAMAGVTRDDLNVANLYDCFTITFLRDLEEMGFCKIGEAAAYMKDVGCGLDSNLPMNTDGGLLSNSHCGEPAGLPTIEVVRQLRGSCGARQVPGARLGVSLSQGFAVHGVAGVTVLGTD